jgi:hypothetical protein
MPKIISFEHKGNFKKTDRFFHRILEMHYRNKLQRYGERGVKALAQATPKDSGETADAWSYEIIESAGRLSIYWKNSNVNDGVNIAVILQYGHGTRNGGYVEGIDYINPAIQPVFREMANEIWKEVVSA